MALDITLRARIETKNGGITIIAFADPSVCDRHAHVSAWSVNSAKLAERLVRAIEAGKILVPVKVATDVLGKTYLAATSLILGRTLNADLKRLGF